MGSSEKGGSDDVGDGSAFLTVACVEGCTVFAADARWYGNEGQTLATAGFQGRLKSFQTTLGTCLPVPLSSMSRFRHRSIRTDGFWLLATVVLSWLRI